MCVYIKISVSLRVSELDKSRETLPETVNNTNTNNNNSSDDTVG